LDQHDLNQQWEQAYQDFETPAQEIRKFKKRLKKLKVTENLKTSQIIDLFCGRGNGICALEELGFQNISGVDLSADLISKYTGQATMRVGDCRNIPFPDNSFDIAIVQGGLHHLISIPNDLEKTMTEAHRLLKPGGQFYIVEPWNTFFLKLLHLVVLDTVIFSSMVPKLNAFKTMVDLEKDTYFPWLNNPELIRSTINQFFHVRFCEIGWGKIFLHLEKTN
jgi:ubiquinone/menaquinone biosynthesis C-methylase UbiE